MTALARHLADLPPALGQLADSQILTAILQAVAQAVVGWWGS